MVQNSYPTIVARYAPLALLRAILKRRTEVALDRLDDRLLSDIGLHRGEIATVARQASLSALPKGNAREFRLSHLLGRARKRVGRWSLRRRAIQELSSLGDRILRDLGIEPDKVVAFVDGAMTDGGRAGRRPIGKGMPVEPMTFAAAVVSPRRTGSRSRVSAVAPLVATDESIDIRRSGACRILAVGAANDDRPRHIARTPSVETKAPSATGIGAMEY